MTSDEGSKEPNKIARLAFPLLGWCMIGHFVFLLGRTFLGGTPEDPFWISHVGTLLGGLGALFRDRRLISVSLVALFSHHLFWLIDTSWWLLTDNFPFGTTTYLEKATLGGWLQSAITSSAYHFCSFWLTGRAELKSMPGSGLPPYSQFSHQ